MDRASRTISKNCPDMPGHIISTLSNSIYLSSLPTKNSLTYSSTNWSKSIGRDLSLWNVSNASPLLIQAQTSCSLNFCPCSGAGSQSIDARPATRNNPINWTETGHMRISRQTSRTNPSNWHQCAHLYTETQKHECLDTTNVHVSSKLKENQLKTPISTPDTEHKQKDCQLKQKETETETETEKISIENSHLYLQTDKQNKIRSTQNNMSTSKQTSRNNPINWNQCAHF